MTSLNYNSEMLNLIQLTTYELLILKSFEKFYENKVYIENFMNIINCNNNISIRLIDYFITKYAKKNKITYKINDSSFNIYQSYKQQLKNFQKKNFDPFARGIKIPYYIDNCWIITTIGQLNFFKWFILKNIHTYIYNNKNVIQLDMNKNKKNIKVKKKSVFIHKKKYNIKNNTFIAKPDNNRTNSQILVTF